MAAQGIILNQDSDNFLFTRKDCLDLIDAQYIKDFIYQYEDTLVTDFVMCVNVHISSFPSKVKTFYGDKYLRKEEQGQSVDYSETCCKTAHHIWHEKKLDLFQLWIDACRESQITPWLSFRMNDAHCHFETPHYLISDFFYEHLDEYARCRHERPFGGNRDYYDRCRDFGIEEVRVEMLAYIEEALERYDVDGIELDFMRELWCFQPGHEQESANVMTDFVQKVKELVQAAEQRYRHKIKIAVRCHANPIYSMEFGFDVLEWAKRGLVDLIVPSPRWATCDNDMPIALWKKMMEPYCVKVAGCVELLSRSYPGSKLVYNTVDSAIGSAVNILSQGADKLYLFNYFDSPDEMLVGERRRITEENDVHKAEGYYKLLAVAGDLEKAMDMPRKHIVTYSDIAPLGRKLGAALPIKITGTGPHFVRVVTGKIPTGKGAMLRLGIESEEALNPENDIAVYVNSNRVGFVEVQTCGDPALTECPVYTFEMKEDVLNSLVQMAEIYGNKEFIIRYVDIMIL